MLLPFSIFLASSVLTFFLIKFLNKRNIMDIPNERSSHSVPVPKGGGIVIVFLFLTCAVSLYFIQGLDLKAVEVVIVSSFILAALSFADDLVELSALKRLLIHLAVAAVTIYQMDLNWSLPVIGHVPFLIEIVLILGWVWFINLFNFMDGIDGISAIEIISILGGIILISYLNDLPEDYSLLMQIFVAATAGFLVWNWHKAKIFLGDVGSVPSGYLIGWFLILLMDAGFVAAALILPLYYLMDATITLFRRAAKKEKIWQAHRSHFYQRALKKYPRHDKIVLKILSLNILLIALGVFSLNHSPLLMLGSAIIITAGLLYSFEKAGR